MRRAMIPQWMHGPGRLSFARNRAPRREAGTTAVGAWREAGPPRRRRRADPRMLAHAGATQPLPKKRSVAETFGECARRRAVSNAAHGGPDGTVFRRGRSYTPPR